MNIDAFIGLLGLEHYHKTIAAAQITSITWHKNRKLVSVFLVVPSTWPFALYKDFKMALGAVLDCDVEIECMATETSLSVKDIAQYMKEYAELSGRSECTRFLPYVEEQTIICEMPQKDADALQGLRDDLGRFLKRQGILYDLVFQNKEIQVDIDVKSRPQPITVKGTGPLRRRSVEHYTFTPISSITEEIEDICIKGEVFRIEQTDMRKRGTIIMSFYITDREDSLTVKCFEGKTFDRDFLLSVGIGDQVKVSGSVKFDPYAKELSLMADMFEKVKVFAERKDEAKEKRIELHAHTKMSEMDGVCDTAALVAQAAAFGHAGIAITDHMVVQAYPDAQSAEAKARKNNPDFRVLYGIEMNMVDPVLDILKQGFEKPLNEVSFVVFDLETTGLSCRYDEIIEFGAVRMKNGDVKERMQCFIKPTQPIPPFITSKTGISDADVANAKSIAEVLPDIIAFFKEDVLVAHNAKFDIGFMNAALKQHGYSTLSNAVVDTLDMAKAVLKNRRLYSLGHIARFYKIAYDEETAHRADYDADVLANVFQLMLYEVKKLGCEDLCQLQSLQDEEAFKKVWKKHVTILTRNQQGLKDLFALVTLSNTKYLASTGKTTQSEEFVAEPRIPRAELQRLREHLLIGSSCANNEVFDIAANKEREALCEAISFYDYIEIQPLENYRHLLDSNAVKSPERLKQVLLDIIDAAKQMGKLIVATGDVHYLHPHHKIYRDVYINAQGIGGIRHPLYFYNRELRKNTSAPNQHFRTTEEMLEAFSFLPKKEAKQYVIDNPNALFQMTEHVHPIHNQLYTPHIDGEEELSNLCFQKAYERYGNPLPAIVEERLKKELNSIIGNGFAVVYYVSHLLVKKSLSEGYMVGSRGSVGSSFVATMADITEVNPLIPHYYCPHCQHSEWIEDNSVASGYDLPNKACPKCQAGMIGDGQDIPFETFLGFEGDKVPDIDLNFSGDYQEHAHAYTKEVFGTDKVYRAGTIGGVAEKTAYGYVSGYAEENDRELTMRSSERTRLAMGCQDVKRTTGQHPGGIIVIPEYMDAHDFTPVQYPANNPDSAWMTTHFDFHAIHDNVLKLDILGHVDPTAMKQFERISKIDPKTIPMNDEKVISLFRGVDALSIDTTTNSEKTGALGLPEFGTPFVRGMLEATRPTSFAELVQISGLSHGTDVWLNNAQELINNQTCVLKDVIGCRDDIMVYLIQKGLPPKKAFDIMESTRKGKGLKEEWKVLMKENNVPDWYIESCIRIKYMFPKAHAVAYVLMAVRVAWFKVYYPHYYYAVFFTTRCDVFDVEVMAAGLDAIQTRLHDIQRRLNHPELKKDVSNKEFALITTLEVAQELYLRGYRIATIDIERSQANEFMVDELDDHVIIPPFGALDGLGANVANSIVEARSAQPFLSQQDMMQRSSINQTSMKKLEAMGVLKELQRENQLSLF